MEWDVAKTPGKCVVLFFKLRYTYKACNDTDLTVEVDDSKIFYSSKYIAWKLKTILS